MHFGIKIQDGGSLSSVYTAADFELDECHVIKNEKVALDRLRVRQNVFLVYTKISSSIAEGMLSLQI